MLRSKLSITEYGEVNGNLVSLFTIKFDGDLNAQLTNYGGIITALSVPDKKGQMEDVVLGCGNFEDYLEEHPYFGALIGRYGNRIANGSFELDGVTYRLATNNGPNHLHGGIKGFDKAVWEVVDTQESEERVTIVLRYISPDREEGYPGTLTTTVTYTFTSEGVTIDYEATTDQKTIVNFTQHSYFNLSGKVGESIHDHKLQIVASEFLPIDSTQIPTGERSSVIGTPFDFREAKSIGRDINKTDQQLAYGSGYDHCWVLDEDKTISERKVATLYHEESRRCMEVYTTQPGIQFYSGNFLDGSIMGKNEKNYNSRDGLCLETQHFPNSPNQADFPSTVLDVGETFHATTSYKFSIRDGR